MAERTIYEAEYRIVLADGIFRWINGRGLYHYGNDGDRSGCWVRFMISLIEAD